MANAHLRLNLLPILTVCIALFFTAGGFLSGCDDNPSDDDNTSGTPTAVPTGTPSAGCGFESVTRGRAVSGVTGPAPSGVSDYCTTTYRYTPASSGGARIVLEYRKPGKIDLEIYRACSNGNLNQKVADAIDENAPDPWEREVIQTDLTAGVTYYICIENKLTTDHPYSLSVN